MTGRNVLKFNQKYNLAKWLNKHMEWCVNKGLRATEVARKAGQELGFPVTVANMKGLWVNQMENVWPFTREISGMGSTTKDALRAENRAIAAALVELYGRLGNMQDCPPEVRRIAGIESLEPGGVT